MTVKVLATAVLPLLLVTSCGAAQPARPLTHVVPDVRGESLEDAADGLDARNIAWTAETPDGDEPLVLHFWRVCDVEPSPGSRVGSVTLHVDRVCD
jgi:hypothetical protein